MPIRIDQLRNAAPRWSFNGSIRDAVQAKRLGMSTAFLSHSHQDRFLAIGLAQLLNEAGWRVYIDWQDEEMPASPNRETATRIQREISETDYFLFLATANSISSRWCPWEIGFADGVKKLDRILMIPTVEGWTTHGNEYLDLYRRVDFSTLGTLSVWQPGTNYGGVSVKSL
jgi:hypothetical protein